ncbi:TrmB family transcriptional regulator [Parablautia muri]|uniref:TrmB family transcriptional regulator n=1 Tax=Parablautia muri TaxID=2320879 RepID=A0A9X5BD80_9FIRM|nr:TrmB family transcriptional regulator [Parablautia muri]NBJ91608.1 TrmB family transcriptional regulator [Parablautia muri]
MEENIVLDKLGSFGLTRQEANIYLCLYQQGELNGYEVAKLTGISRSNVYSGLSVLTDKGAAYLIEGSSNKYMAVPIEEFCENKIRSLCREKEYLIKNIPAIKKSEIGYITITGSQNIWDKIIHMIQEAQMRIYFSASYEIIEKLQEEFCKVLEKKIKLVLITDNESMRTGIASDLPSFENANGDAALQMDVISELKKHMQKDSTIYRGSAKGNSIRLIIDSEYALTGEFTGSKDDTCLYTGQRNFISVFKETLRNEIKLIRLQGGENYE